MEKAHGSTSRSAAWTTWKLKRLGPSLLALRRVYAKKRFVGASFTQMRIRSGHTPTFRFELLVRTPPFSDLNSVRGKRAVYLAGPVG